MTLQQCKYIVKLAECRSFNEAARELYVTQSSLSAAIKSAEEKLGITIFKRSNKGIEFTTEGAELLEYARRIVLQMDEIDMRFNDKKSNKERLSISTVSSSLAGRACVELYNQVDASSFTINIIETDSRNIIEDVENGKSDIGLLSINSTNEKAISRMFKEKGLIFNPIGKTKLYMSCKSDHPLAKKNVVTLKDIEAYPNLFSFNRKDSVFDFADRILEEYNPPKKFTVTSSAMLYNLLKETDAIMLNNKTTQDGLVSVPFNHNIVYTFGYIVRENAIPTKFVKKYLEILDSYKH